MSARLFIAVTFALGVAAAATQTTAPTEVVILGVTHSGMLVAESYQPAVFRAFFDRVKPTTICIERAPEEFARGSHYEFTYEIQHIAVPYAREQGIPLCPFDWLPSVEDQMLAFGVDLSQPPFVRGPNSYGDFLAFSGKAALQRDLFYAEDEQGQEKARSWFLTMAPNARADFARRLFLYRTFMQAMRIRRAASTFAGGRLLVIVGDMHLSDLRSILAKEQDIRLVPPMSFGAPPVREVGKHVRAEDLLAIASFNLLGVQHATGILDLGWLQRVLEQLESMRPGPETQLLRTRHQVLNGSLKATTAVEQYDAIMQMDGAQHTFTWDGVLNRQRLDSFFDPFGNLTIDQRALLEKARELARDGHVPQAETLVLHLEGALSSMKAAQLRTYAPQWLLGRK